MSVWPDIKRYAEYRRAELEDERKKRAQNAALGGSMVGYADYARQVAIVLDELTRLADWDSKGGPVFMSPLSDSEKDRWRWARAQGMEVPEEIAEQL